MKLAELNFSSIQEIVKQISELSTRTAPEKAPNAVKASNSKLDLFAVSSGSADGKWRCPKCGDNNSTSIRTCKSCGYIK